MKLPRDQKCSVAMSGGIGLKQAPCCGFVFLILFRSAHDHPRLHRHVLIIIRVKVVRDGADQEAPHGVW